MDDNDLDLFLHTVTDDEIMAKLNSDMSVEEKFRIVYQEEVMRTVIDGRYSGICFASRSKFVSRSDTVCCQCSPKVEI